MKAFELGARLARRFGGGDAIAFAEQKAREQRADAAVVVDDKQMRRIIGGIGRGQCHAPQSRPLACARSARAIMRKTRSRSSSPIMPARKRRATSRPPGPS